MELSLFLEDLGHGQPHLQDLQDLRPQRRRRRLLQLVRRGHHGQLPSTPTSAAGQRNFRQDHGHFHGDQSLRPATYPVNSACSGSPVLSLHGVTIIRKIAACWACGRTFWVWRLSRALRKWATGAA